MIQTEHKSENSAPGDKINFSALLKSEGLKVDFSFYRIRPFGLSWDCFFLVLVPFYFMTLQLLEKQPSGGPDQPIRSRLNNNWNGVDSFPTLFIIYMREM